MRAVLAATRPPHRPAAGIWVIIIAQYVPWLLAGFRASGVPTRSCGVMFVAV